MKSLLNYISTTTYPVRPTQKKQQKIKADKSFNYPKEQEMRKELLNQSCTENIEDLFEESSKEESLVQESDEIKQQNPNQLPLLHLSLNYKGQSLIVPIYYFSSELSIKQSLIQLNVEQENLQKIYEICRFQIEQYLKVLERKVGIIHKENDNLNILQEILKDGKYQQLNENSQFQFDKVEIKNGQILIDVLHSSRILKFVFQKFRIQQFVQCERLKNFGRKFQVNLSKCVDYVNVLEKISNEQKLSQKKREELDLLVQNKLLSLLI